MLKIHKYTHECVKVTTKPKMQIFLNTKGRLFEKQNHQLEKENNKNGDYKRIFQAYQLYQ